MTEGEMETITIDLRLPKGHEPVYVLLVSGMPDTDADGGERLAVTPQWQPLAEKMVARSNHGTVALAIMAVANRGLANTIAVILQAGPIDTKGSWKPGPAPDRRMPPGVAS
ncbi:MAG: hypothetical protein V3W28_08905 [Thermoplasmata archaeon]